MTRYLRTTATMAFAIMWSSCDPGAGTSSDGATDAGSRGPAAADDFLYGCPARTPDGEIASCQETFAVATTPQSILDWEPTGLCSRARCPRGARWLGYCAGLSIEELASPHYYSYGDGDAELFNAAFKCLSWGGTFILPGGSEVEPGEPLGNIRTVAAGVSHACALMEDRTVMCWGSNEHGALGNGTDVDAVFPVPRTVVGLEDVASISVGEDFTCALLEDASVMCWGRNDRGQCGVAPSEEPIATPVAVADLVDIKQLDVSGVPCALRADGRATCWGSDAAPTLITGDYALDSLCVGGRCGLTVDGSLLMLRDGRASTGNTQFPPLRAAASARATCGIDFLGDVYCGEGGDAVRKERFANASSIGFRGQTPCTLDTEGRVRCDTSEDAAALEPFADVNDATTLTINFAIGCARLADGTAVCWGDPSDGALGNFQPRSQDVSTESPLAAPVLDATDAPLW